nr:hypothetical protein [uncultured Campylobacter sp.]
MILVPIGGFFSFIVAIIAFYIIIKIGLKKCDEQEKRLQEELIEYDLKHNKTMQEIRRKAGCKDIHAWDIKNI